MSKELVFFWTLLKTSMKASISKRGAFLLEAGLMIANNLIFFTLWWIFFKKFKSIGGWGLSEMTILMAIGSGSYGLMQILFGGVKNLGRMIIGGGLDPFMTQPKNLLLHLIGSASLAKGWGHLATGLLLVLFGGIASLSTFPLFIVCMASGCLVFTAMNVIALSLPFWLGSMDSVSRKYCEILFLFALYPTHIYTGLLQVVMFTVIPAGIIGYLPVELVRDFSFKGLIVLIACSLLFLGLAFTTFYSGLKKYESSNLFR
ncbi:MAG: ABC transporter permease [Parachlamydia sp.]|jgi:ABC-2 type transport system permease protein|nr:ABC transporter permease [Parachlamydia sp.]